MLCSFLLGQHDRALQAEIVGCERSDCLAIGSLGRLRHDGVIVEDTPQDHLVVLDRSIGDILGLAEELLDMFYRGLLTLAYM